MALVLARVDDRLIHGQVVVGWVRALRANSILVVNDAVSADPLQRSLLPLAVPPEIQVRLCRVTEAADILKLEDTEKDEKKLIVLFSNPVDVLRFMSSGGKLAELNLGGLRFGPGKTQVHPAISLGQEDIEALYQLRKMGLAMSICMVPEEKAEDIFELIDGVKE